MGLGDLMCIIINMLLPIEKIISWESVIQLTERLVYYIQAKILAACMIQNKIMNHFVKHKLEAGRRPSAHYSSNPMSCSSYLVNKLNR